MQNKITEMEVDMQELSLLLKAYFAHPNEVARKVVERKLRRVQEQLADFEEELEETPVVEARRETTPDVTEQPVPVSAMPLNDVPTPILAERIKPATDLIRSVSLNDTFRFSRELFNGDTERMYRILQRLGEQRTLENALTLLAGEVQANEENEALIDLEELLKKFFA